MENGIAKCIAKCTQNTMGNEKEWKNRKEKISIGREREKKPQMGKLNSHTARDLMPQTKFVF